MYDETGYKMLSKHIWIQSNQANGEKAKAEAKLSKQ